ncbi:beta-lactamase-like protein [Apodospora peruviana]|uniref:Beta-lactamase-like protein n=1 Tax=Apodospora peruviana TaxID=516989 RepID=A0AAE0HVI1_9PEZI|nr:beta-lactamase-like protein [Apodospora peruviana]
MLPQPLKTGKQSFVTVSPILGGKITLPEKYFVDPADETAFHTVPSLSFLITSTSHQPWPRRILFDLGLRSRITDYSEPQQRHLANRTPYTIGPGVAAILRSEGLDPASDIDTVILSHVHYDHHGDPDHFPGAQFVVGPGTDSLLEHGLLGSAGSHQHFSGKDLLPVGRTVELPFPGTNTGDDGIYEWKSFGSMNMMGIDFLGDGSVYILDSPGHLPGHVNLLCRISEKKWICLCGDAYHDRRLLTGEKGIAFWEQQEQEEKVVVCCIHHDPPAAERALKQLRELASLLPGDVEMIGAHDAGWFAQANREGRMFPACL